MVKHFLRILEQQQQELKWGKSTFSLETGSSQNMLMKNNQISHDEIHDMNLN